MLSTRLSHSECCCDENTLIIELFLKRNALKAAGESAEEEDKLIAALTGKSCPAAASASAASYKDGKNILSRLRSALHGKRPHAWKP